MIFYANMCNFFIHTKLECTRENSIIRSCVARRKMPLETMRHRIEELRKKARAQFPSAYKTKIMFNENEARRRQPATYMASACSLSDGQLQASDLRWRASADVKCSRRRRSENKNEQQQKRLTLPCGSRANVAVNRLRVIGGGGISAKASKSFELIVNLQNHKKVGRQSAGCRRKQTETNFWRLLSNKISDLLVFEASIFLLVSARA